MDNYIYSIFRITDYIFIMSKDKEIKEYIYKFIHPIIGEVQIFTKTKREKYVEYYTKRLTFLCYKFLLKKKQYKKKVNDREKEKED